MKEKDAKYPFMISNTDRSDKDGTHWWSILDLHLNKDFFSFTINEVLFGLNKFKQVDNKVPLVKTFFQKQSMKNQLQKNYQS